MPKKDGGAAFPMEFHGGEGSWREEGMSLRDRIALEALGGMLAHPTRYKPRPGAPTNWHEAISEEAYQIADAMIEAREK